MKNSTNSSQGFMACVDDADSVVDALDLLFIERYTSGTHPYARSTRVPRVRKDATLLPPGVEPIRVAIEDGTRSVLASGMGWTLSAVRWPQGNGRVSVVAHSEALAKEILELATRGASAPPPARIAGPGWASGTSAPTGHNATSACSTSSPGRRFVGTTHQRLRRPWTASCRCSAAM